MNPLSAMSEADRTREEFEAWAKADRYGQSLLKTHAWYGWLACSTSHASEVKRLREALEGMCNLLLVVWDLKEWTPNDYAEYKAARAALQGDK